MAFYTSFLRLSSTSSCYYPSVVQLMKNELRTFKILNLKRRRFMSSFPRKRYEWKFKELKNSKLDSPENFTVQEPTPFSVHLLVKPFLFTVAFSAASIAGTAIWQYENLRKKATNLMRRQRNKLSFYGKKRYSFRNELNRWWNQLTEGQKLFAPLCFVNVVIFLAWRIPRFQPTMIKYFCSTPFSEAVCWPMVLCTFSHYNILHLTANMYVLHSFSNMGVELLGKEQFLGLYLSGGVISSFVSYLYKAIITKQTLSMGASGAVMAILAYACSKYPDSKLAIVFLPWIVFSAGTGLKCLMSIDLAGVLCRWKFLDHAGHLGGALSGLVWCYWGNAYIWQKREPLLHWWHEIRSASK